MNNEEIINENIELKEYKSIAIKALKEARKDQTKNNNKAYKKGLRTAEQLIYERNIKEEIFKELESQVLVPLEVFHTYDNCRLCIEYLKYKQLKKKMGII